MRRQGCGTPAGYTWHNAHHEPPCTACRTAKNRYDAIRSIRTGITQGSVIPHDVLADLYLNATIPAQERFEDAMGMDFIDAVIDRAEATENQEVA